MQLCMFGTNLAIVGGSILEVITVAILFELLPLGSHLGRSIDEVVFSTEVVAIVGLVDCSDVVQKLFERLTIATLIGKRRRFINYNRGSP